MDPIRKEALDAFNQQVRAIRRVAADQDARVSLVTFGTHADAPVLWEEPVSTLAELGLEDYRPEGMTAMLDAVGRTLFDLRALPGAAEDRFLVAIISDGQENNSRHHTWSSVAELVQACQATERWTFDYLGANQDLAAVGRRLALHEDALRSFEADAQGLTDAARALSRRSMSFVTGLSPSPSSA